MQLNEREWGHPEERVAAVEESRFPVVFAFRPTKFLVVNPDKRDEWEKLFVDNVGMRPDREAASRWSGDPKETISGSNSDWDDCDYW